MKNKLLLMILVLSLSVLMFGCQKQNKSDNAGTAGAESKSESSVSIPVLTSKGYDELIEQNKGKVVVVIGLKHNIPEGTYFVMVDIQDFLNLPQFAGYSDLEFCEWMIREIGVAAVPGSSFFREPVNNLIRLHFARSEETIDEAIRRLSRMAELLK